MADNGVDVARLRLTPAHLGPLEIHISVEDDRAQVWFGTQHSQTRDALESALPRLREMFAEQGLELTQADVEDQSDRQEQRELPQPTGAAAIALHQAERADRGLPNLPGWGAEPGTLDIYV